MDIRERIGARICETRKKQGLTIQALSKKIGTLSAGRISNWENGTRMPGPNEAILLSRALNVAASYLLCLSDSPDGAIRLAADLPRYIPVISLNDVNKTKKTLTTLRKNIFSSDAIQKISLEYKSSSLDGDYFLATQITDNSMSPFISPNDLVIIDCNRTPKPGDIVLAHLTSTKENIIRKYKRTEKTAVHHADFELIAINSDWGRLQVAKKNKATILGVVVEQRKYF